MDRGVAGFAQSPSAPEPMPLARGTGTIRRMLQLFQTEWCRGSKTVRQRMTELGIDFVARQVPADPAERDALERDTGVRSVPVLMFEDGAVIVGSERIVDYLDNLPERSDADVQRERAHRSLCKQCAEVASEQECEPAPTSHHPPRVARAG